MAPELRTAHTADLDASTRSAIRALMDAAFGCVSVDLAGELVCDWRPGSLW